MEQRGKINKPEAVPETGAAFYTPPPVPAMPPGEEMAVEPLEIEQRRREAEILSSVQYLLEPHVPEELKEEFKKYEMLISKNLAISNIEPDDVYRYLDFFDLIRLWFKFKRPDMAVKNACRLIMELQLKRSVKGFERISEISTRQTVEQLQSAIEKRKKRGFLLFR